MRVYWDMAIMCLTAVEDKLTLNGMLATRHKDHEQGREAERVGFKPYKTRNICSGQDRNVDRKQSKQLYVPSGFPRGRYASARMMSSRGFPLLPFVLADDIPALSFLHYPLL